MSVTLLDVWRAARARSVPFSGDSAGYLALALCEEASRAPRAVELAQAELESTGTVRLTASAPRTEEELERELRSLLGSLLEVSSSPGPALLKAAVRPSGSGLAALNAELRKALIPFNRAAAQRALLRLYRETERALARGATGDAVPERPSQAERTAQTERASQKQAAAHPTSSREVAADSVSLNLLSPSSPAPAARCVVMDSPIAPPVAPAPVKSVHAPPPPPVTAESLVAAPVAVEPISEVALTATSGEPTKPETVVARIRARAREQSLPPLPNSGPVPPAVHLGAKTTGFGSSGENSPSRSAGDTPRMGSVDVDVTSGERSRAATASPSAQLVVDDVTQRTPEVAELPEDDAACALLDLTSAAELEEEPADEACTIALALPSKERPEPPAPELPPADDEVETRPLPLKKPVAPYPGLPAQQSDVSALLSGFQVAGGASEHELRRELSSLAGVDLTPGRPTRLGKR